MLCVHKGKVTAHIFLRNILQMLLYEQWQNQHSMKLHVLEVNRQFFLPDWLAEPNKRLKH